MLNLKYLLPTASVNKKDIIILANCCLILPDAVWILFLINIKPRYYLGIIELHLPGAKWRIIISFLESIHFSVLMMTQSLNFWEFHTTSGTASFSHITHSVLRTFQADQGYLKVLDNAIEYVILFRNSTDSISVQLACQPLLFSHETTVSHATKYITWTLFSAWRHRLWIRSQKAIIMISFDIQIKIRWRYYEESDSWAGL